MNEDAEKRRRKEIAALLAEADRLLKELGYDEERLEALSRRRRSV